MKIKSGIFLLSVGLCITVGNMAQATGRPTPTREGVASAFTNNSFNPFLGSAQGVPQTPLQNLEVQCPKNGFLVARADALFLFHIPAELPGFASVGFGVTRDDEEKAAFGTATHPVTVPFRNIQVPFSQASEELRTSQPEQTLTGSIQRVDRCEKGDEFSYELNVFVVGTADKDELIVTVVEPVLVVEFFQKSIQTEDSQNNNGQNNQ